MTLQDVKIKTADGWVSIRGGGSLPDDVIVEGDPRLSNARTPTAHAASHQAGGTDELDVTTLGGFPGGGTFLRADGTFATPSGAGNVTGPGSSVAGDVAVFADGTGTLLSDSGIDSADLILEGDSRLTDDRTPTAHASTHYDGASDEVDITALGGFPGGTTQFLREDGTFATPPGSGGNTQITYGTNATFKATPPSSPNAGDMFKCSDSAYEYVYDGAAWQAYLHGIPVVEPVGLTKINSGPTTTLDVSRGGMLFRCTSAGDQVVSYVMAVTPSSTLKVGLGMTALSQAGIVIYNSNTNKVYFFRFINNGTGSYELYRTLYTSDGASLSTPNTAIQTRQQVYPFNALILRFDATKLYIDIPGTDLDLDGIEIVEAVYNETLSTNIGSNFTHIGFGVNNSSPNIAWGLHLKQISA